MKPPELYATTPKLIDALDELCARPEYRAVVNALMAAMTAWRWLHPKADIRWIDNGSRLLVGVGLGDDGAAELLAATPSAAALLEHANRTTGGVASLVQAQLALAGLGWVTR